MRWVPPFAELLPALWLIRDGVWLRERPCSWVCVSFCQMRLTSEDAQRKNSSNAYSVLLGEWGSPFWHKTLWSHISSDIWGAFQCMVSCNPKKGLTLMSTVVPLCKYITVSHWFFVCRWILILDRSYYLFPNKRCINMNNRIAFFSEASNWSIFFPVQKSPGSHSSLYLQSRSLCLYLVEILKAQHSPARQAFPQIQP